MNPVVPLLCAVLAPSPQSPIKLPQSPLKLPPSAQQPAPQVRPVSELERFRRDVQDLQASPARLEEGLRALGETYRALDSLVVEVARSARANEMTNLMPVARRYGTMQGSRIGDELLFQLLARPLGEATRDVVATLAALQGAAAAPALKEVVRGRVAAARRYAVEFLAPLLTADDLDFCLALSREQVLDLQLRGIELLGRLPLEASLARLVELLAKDPAVAGVACATLIQVGPPAVAPLQQACAGPAIDRAFAYAAFALAQIGQAGGDVLVPEAAAPTLQKCVRDIDPLTSLLAAVPLADLAFAGCVATAREVDVDLVDALLEVVQPQRFVANLDLLRRPAEQRLLRLTGRVDVSGALSWRDWWQTQRAEFVGLHADVAVNPDQVAHTIVTWRHEHQLVRLVAEGLADVAPCSGATEVVVTAAQMQALVQELKAGGFGAGERMRVQSGLPIARSLQIQTRTGRAQVAVPLAAHPAFDALVALVQRTVDAELWQLYRDAEDEPDRGAFWRSERRWLDANPDATERGRRFARRVVGRWGELAMPLRARALEHILLRPDRSRLFGEQDGEAILQALASVATFGDLDLRLLELAAAVPGDRIWPRCVALAAAQKGAGHAAVRAVFKVLGPDAVLAALDDANASVRRAAVEEVVAVNDLRASARLVQLLADPDVEVRRYAAMACGRLRIAAAAEPVVAAIVAEDTPPMLRRECLRAIGSIGGALAFPVLQRAMAAPDMDDKEAALRGLGELRDPRAAALLAELLVVANGKDLGQLARLQLQRQGGVRAVPALRAQLDVVQDPVIRRQLVLLLGYYQEPAVVPDLIDLLVVPALAAEATDLLAATTGLDVAGATDRVAAMETWWRTQKRAPQWQWMLDALTAASVATSLRAEHFDGSLRPVAELSRLLVELQEPRLWVLTAAVLRLVTKQDHGVVTMGTPREVREGIAAHYRLLVETESAAQGR
ncbi:MAG: HEAT repeat domain-containing protein [Planctomycetes bacterium]|nr:HEAT repeat domain-containing protein [Planctomycetota bacterium]